MRLVKEKLLIKRETECLEIDLTFVEFEHRFAKLLERDWRLVGVDKVPKLHLSKWKDEG